MSRDQSKNNSLQEEFVLTDEELAELSKNNSPLLEEIKKVQQGGTASPALLPWLHSWRRNRMQSVAEEQASKIQSIVAGSVKQPVQASLLQWCGFPTDLTRVSPFFPLAQNELKEREFLENFTITAANWGFILYTGPKLSIMEEDALLALLALLQDKSNKHRHDDLEEGKKTYTYKGPALPILKILGKGAGATEYSRLIRSLKLLVSAGVQMQLDLGPSPKTKKGKQKKPRFIQMTTMLSNVAWDEEKKELSVTINPFFYETYRAAAVSLYDVQKRMQISGSIAKSLYRFVQSHSPKNPLWAGHFLTLAQSLNVNTNESAFRIRYRLKNAIKELVQHGILTEQSGLAKNDIVVLYRGGEALPPKKSKKALGK